ncbi:oligosaccharide flippase family protein [Kineococcus sp. NUM-3379]
MSAPASPPAQASLRGRAAAGVLWNALQMWIVRLTTVAAFIVISRHLQPSEFGLIALGMAVIGVLMLLGDSGMTNYIIRTEELDERVRSTAFWTGMLLAGTLAGALALLARPTAALFGEPDLAPVLRWLSLGLVLTGLASVPSALLRRRLEFRSLAIRGTVATFVGSAVAITAAVAGAGVWALVAQYLVRAVVGGAVVWAAARWRPRFLLDRAEARRMLTFGSKLLGIDLLMQARDRGEEFVLGAISTATTLGLWTVATRLVRIIQETGSSVVSSVATPAFARLQDDLPRLHRAYATSLSTTALAMFPAFLLLAVTSPDLVPFLLGRQWAGTAVVAQVVALTALVGVLSHFDRPVFMALDRLRPELLIVGGTVVVHLALVVVFAPRGLVPLALALLVRALLTLPVRQVVLHRVTGMPYGALLGSGRVLVAALLMAACVQGAVWALDDAAVWARLLLAALVAALTYPPLLWLFARPVVRSVLGDVRSLRRRGAPARTAAGADAAGTAAATGAATPAAAGGVADPADDPALPRASAGAGRGEAP